MKVIRISDKLHTKLKDHAGYDRRTINQEAEIILELYFDDAEGGLTTEKVAKKRLLEKLAVKEHIVKEGKALGLLSKRPPYPKNAIAKNPEHPEDFGVVTVTTAPEEPEVKEVEDSVVSLMKDIAIDGIETAKLSTNPVPVTDNPLLEKARDNINNQQIRKKTQSSLCPHGSPWLTCKVASCGIKGRNMGLA